MGLPQVSSSETVEEVGGSLSTFLHSPPHFVGVSTCDLDGMHVGSISQTHFVGVSTCDLDGMHVESISRTVGDSLCSSLGDFCRKTSLDQSKSPDDSFKCKGAMDAISNVHGLKIGSKDKLGWLTPNTGQNIQSPASRIVGFECGWKDCFFDGSNEISTEYVHSSSVVGNAVNESESSSSLVRKRLLSPLSHVLSADQFSGDPLDIGCCNSQKNSPDSCSVSKVQDYKKANIGSRNHFTTPIWSVSNCSERKDMLYDYRRRASMFFTDGPLLEEKEVLPYTCLSLPGLDHLKESSKVRTQTGGIYIFPEKVIASPLSLSPLGPKFSETMQPAGECRNVRKEREGDLTFKTVEQSFDKTISGNIFGPEGSKSFEDIGLLHKESHLSSLQRENEKSWTSSHDFISQSMKLARSLRGLPVRRSLVGSFEESLLSGRLSSGKLRVLMVF